MPVPCLCQGSLGRTATAMFNTNARRVHPRSQVRPQCRRQALPKPQGLLQHLREGLRSCLRRAVFRRALPAAPWHVGGQLLAQPLTLLPPAEATDPPSLWLCRDSVAPVPASAP